MSEELFPSGGSPIVLQLGIGPGAVKNINAAGGENRVFWDEITADHNSAGVLSMGTNVINVDASGYRLKLHANVHVAGAASRFNGRLQIKKNGTNFLKSASASMYIRNSSGHTESSGTITLWDDGVSTAGDYYEVFITRETTITTTVNTVVNGSAFWIEAYG